MVWLYAELVTLGWMALLALLVGWVTDAWLLTAWLLLLVMSLRWGLALWAAADWHRSGGRRLNSLWAGSLGDFLYAVGHLLEKERRQTQQLIERARYFKNAAEALPEGIVALDADNRVDWFNQGAMSLLGMARQHRGKPLTLVVRYPQVLALVEQDSSEPVELEDVPAPGQSLSFQIIPYLQGHRLLIVRDITQFRRTDAVRRDFIANASHELRTPLTVMQGYLEAMIDTPGSCAPEWSKPLDQMYNQVERMRKIIEDMLTLSVLEADAGPLKSTVVDVPVLLRRLVEEARQLSGGRGHQISLQLDSPQGLLGHEEYLRSAFTNLVSNAVRYTPDGGAIHVRWWSDAEGAHLAVTDAGIGIAPEHLPRITERFYRADTARSRATGGTGLGLSITRHVLDRHGARLAVSSELGKGSSFSCHFPPAMMIDLGED